MTKVKLSEVFGISHDIPKFTYVDRALLDKIFAHHLAGQKHIVLHGASKQGKSCLRKKNIDETTCAIVQCLPLMNSDNHIWRTALQKLGLNEVDEVSTESKTSEAITGEGGVEASVPGLLKAKTGAHTESGSEQTSTIKETPIHSESYLARLGRALRESGKHLVLEDFHYLPEETRIQAAFGLKALYEEGAYVIVVGIWSEQNLLTFYNGDLTGRTEEINLIWNDSDLEQVIRQGEGALNIVFAPGLKSEIITSSFQNVGLVQRIAEKICLRAGILETQDTQTVISDTQLLKNAHEDIVSDIRQRYARIAQVFVEGMRADSQLHLYGRIYNELLDASDAELMEGIGFADLLKRMQGRTGKEIRQSDLTQSLDRIEKLQAARKITPLLVSYSKSLRKLFLNDREFLFYRRYSGDDTNNLKVDFND